MSNIIVFIALSWLLLCSNGVLGFPQRPILHGISPPAAAITGRRWKSSSRAILQAHQHYHHQGIVHVDEERSNWRGPLTSSRSGLAFSVIHRQHPNSPYRQADKSHGELMEQHVRRGLLRLDALHKSTVAERSSNTMPLAREGSYALQEKVVGPAGEWQGEYMVQMQLGTPARAILLIIDTGSGLTWVQCSPCTQCFVQLDPIFDPMQSTTYERVNCSNPACGSNSVFQCSETHNRTCEYGVQYGMTSFTTGVVSTDTLTVDSLSGKALEIDKFLFGCGMFNMGQMVGNSGLLGLSRSNISFPTQLAASNLNFTRKFTHCFADLAANRNATSFMYLGDSRSHQLAYTPFAVPPFRTQFYYVNLVGISVEGVLLPIPSSAFEFASDGSGGTVIDSGTTMTVLVQSAYVRLRDAFRSAAVSKHRLNSTEVPGGFNSTVASHVIDTCYQIGSTYSPRQNLDSDYTNDSDLNSNVKKSNNKPYRASRVPSVTLHFANRVDLSLPPNNILFPFNDEGLYCLAFTGTMSEVGGMNVIGNIQQQNFRIEYDLENSRIGFGRAYCAAEK